jgi:hypothetical protein
VTLTASSSGVLSTFSQTKISTANYPVSLINIAIFRISNDALLDESWRVGGILKRKEKKRKNNEAVDDDQIVLFLAHI